MFEAREVIDAGFLELVRYGVRRADDPLIVDSLKVVDHVLKRETPKGPCWRRYNHDGYGQRKDGGAYEGTGQGRSWPLLTGERGHYELAAGRDAREYIKAMEQFASIGGMLPEQVWDEADLPAAGMVKGEPAGSAQPLVWAHSEYIRLLKFCRGWRGVLDCIGAAKERYSVPAGLSRRFWSNVEFFKLRRPRGVNSRRDDAACDPCRASSGWCIRRTTGRRRLTGWSRGRWGMQGHSRTLRLRQGRPGQIELTLYWPAEDHWHRAELRGRLIVG